MSPSRTLSLPLLLLVIAGCNKGSNAPAPIAGATIAATGGVLEVGTGKLAGVKVEVPAGAVSGPVHITATEAFTQAHPGFKALSRGVTLAPDTPFLLPVHVSLPVPPSALSSNETLILERTASGDILEIHPVAIDGDLGVVTFDTMTLSTFWIAERLFLGVGSDEFWTLMGDDQWVFENGLSMGMTMEFAEPNFSTYTYKLHIEGPHGEIGLYLDRHWSGTTQLLGTYSTVGNGFQHLHDRQPLMGRMTLGQPIVDDYTFDAYAPFGATAATGHGTASLDVIADDPLSIVTPVDTYHDLLEVRFTATEYAPNGTPQSTTEFAITFSHYFGPVALEAFGRKGGLVSGIVGGVPIGQ